MMLMIKENVVREEGENLKELVRGWWRERGTTTPENVTLPVSNKREEESLKTLKNLRKQRDI